MLSFITGIVGENLTEVISGVTALFFAVFAVFKTKQNANLKRDNEVLANDAKTAKRMDDAANRRDDRPIDERLRDHL